MPVDDESSILPSLEQDAKDVIALKPELTDEQKAVAEKLRPQLKAIVRTEVRVELEAEYIKKYKAFEEQTFRNSQEAVKKAIGDWKEDQQPLTNAEVSTLLSQDYLSFEVKFLVGRGKDKKEVLFNLVELPQEIEGKFLKTLKKRFVPLMKNFTAAEFKLDLNTSSMEKLQSLIEAIPELLDVFAELVAICLDPWGDNTEYGKISESWVKQNLATHRILAILIGQTEVNRYRDFFLNGFRLSKSLK